MKSVWGLLFGVLLLCPFFEISGETDASTAMCSQKRIIADPQTYAMAVSHQTAYVGEWNGNRVFVVNGSTDRVDSTFNVTDWVSDIKLNSNNDKLYVSSGRYTVVSPTANYSYWESTARISVVNSQTNKILKNNIQFGFAPVQLTIDPITDKVYAAYLGAPVRDMPNNNLALGGPSVDLTRVYVIDGSSDSIVSTFETPSPTYLIAINPNTNELYVVENVTSSSSFTGFEVYVIDGNSYKTLDAIKVKTPANLYPSDIAVNSKTNKIYVTVTCHCGAEGDGTLYVIDRSAGTLDTAKPISLPAGPNSIAIDELRDEIYTVDEQSATISVINGITDNVTKNLDAVNMDPVAIASNQYNDSLYVSGPPGLFVFPDSNQEIRNINNVTSSIYFDGSNYTISGLASNNVALTPSFSVTPQGVELDLENNSNGTHLQLTIPASLIDGLTDVTYYYHTGNTPMRENFTPVESSPWNNPSYPTICFQVPPGVDKIAVNGRVVPQIPVPFVPPPVHGRPSGSSEYPLNITNYVYTFINCPGILPCQPTIGMPVILETTVVSNQNQSLVSDGVFQVIDHSGYTALIKFQNATVAPDYTNYLATSWTPLSAGRYNMQAWMINENNNRIPALLSNETTTSIVVH